MPAQGSLDDVSLVCTTFALDERCPRSGSPSSESGYGDSCIYSIINRFADLRIAATESVA